MTGRVPSKKKRGSRHTLTAEFLAKRAHDAFKKWRHSGRKKHIHCAVELATGADRRTSAPIPFLLRNLAGYLNSRHEELKRFSDLDTAIMVAKRGIIASQNDRREKALLLNTLAVVFLSRYSRRPRSVDLRKAVQAANKAVMSLPRHNWREMPTLLNTLASAFQHLHKHTGKSLFLDAAVRVAQIAALCPTPLDPMRPIWLFNYSVLLKRRFMLRGEAVDLKQAISAAGRAMNCIPDGHPGKPSILNALGAHWNAYYELENSTLALEKAVQYGNKAVELTPSSSPSKSVYLGNLSISLVNRHRLNGNLDDLEKAVCDSEAAVRAVPKGHESELEIRHNLAERQADMYRWTKDVDYLDLAIENMRQTLKSTPEDDHDYASRHDNLATVLFLQFEKTGSLESLNTAIKLSERSVQVTHTTHPDRCIYLSNLGSHYASLYDTTTEMIHLKHALKLTEEAVERVQTSSMFYPTIVGQLGGIFERIYERSGQRRDLERATLWTTTAVEFCPNETIKKAARLCDLGNLLEIQYLRTGAMSDLDEAIAKTREALQSTPRGHPDLPGLLNNLAIKLHAHYARTGLQSAIDEAVDHASLAVKQTACDHLDWAMYASTLATAFHSRYENARYENSRHRKARLEKTDQQEDLAKAIAYERKACDTMPQDHNLRMLFQHNLGVSLSTLYEETSDEKHLSEAIQLLTEAASLAPLDSPLQAGRKNTLASLLEMRYNKVKGSGKRREIMRIALEVWYCTAAVPFERVKAAYRSLRMFAEELQSEAHIGDQGSITANICSLTLHRALSVAFSVLDLLPIVHARYLNRKDQQFVISSFSGVASLAAYLCLKAGKEEKAVECLERGRTVIINQLLKDREDFSRLSRTHSVLATTYAQLVAELNVNPLPNSSGSGSNARRKEAARELDICIAEIRKTYGSGFLNSTDSVPSMQEKLGSRHVILVNVTEYGSHAIIVSRDTLMPRPLPNLTASETKKRFDKNWAQKHSNKQQKKNTQLLEALKWLWDNCVSLVLLKISPAPSTTMENLPRVCWIGTGLASSLPFHAAGEYVPDSTSNAFSWAISSYAPSIMSLTHSIHQDLKRSFLQKKKGRLLLATMHTTPPGDCLYDELRVDTEIDNVLQSVGSQMEVKVLGQPSVEEVSEALKTCCIAHFACHGKADRCDPSNTALILQRSGAEGTLKQDPLSVQTISNLKLEQAHIAYLSACSTAENRAQGLTDEVIHLASGFLVAGFPHVIGSLWRARDSECIELATNFYAEAFDARSGFEEDVAMAFHRAIQKLRTGQLSTPTNWAQFVHWGI